MTKFLEHFLMSTETIKEYLIHEINLFSNNTDLTVTEIGDGNINYVFKATDEKSGKSVVIKQADVLLRSSGRPLDISRSTIEANALKIQHALNPGYVPEVYDYNETMSTLTMEDISDYKNLRYELMNEQIFPNLSTEISTFLANTLLPTTDLCLDRHKKKELVKQFTNIEMCDISENLVFTEPYYDYRNQNIILEENKSFVEQNIYQNEPLIYHVAILRNRYMNNPQSLIHGDLHSGSIFINENGIKIIDPEFAFYGPAGYDIGNVIGNLFFPLAQAHYFDGHLNFHEWLQFTIRDIFDGVKKNLNHVYDNKVTLPLYRNKQFQHTYVNNIMSDSLGYAGTEIIRRVIGDSKVLEITDAPFGHERIEMERALLKLGIELIFHREEVTAGDQLMQIFQTISK